MAASNSSTNAERSSLSVALIGPAGSGKSSLLGYLLVALGVVQPHAAAKAEKDALDMGSKMDKYRLIVDRSKPERQHHCTMHMRVTHFVTPKHDITITDVPGSRKFVRRVTAGVAGQDCVILVIDGSTDIFEQSLDSTDGLLYEHAFIATGLNTRQLVVAVNKMDVVGWSEARFKQINDELSKQLARFGFRGEAHWVPVSSYHGDNLAAPSTTHMPWYSGRTLLEALEAAQPLQRQQPAAAAPGRALLLPVQSVLRISGIGTVALGRVECGSVKPGMEVVLLPGAGGAASTSCVVKSVERHQAVCNEGLAGQCVGLSLKGVRKEQVRPGCLICDATSPPPQTASFLAKIRITRTDQFGRGSGGAQKQRPPCVHVGSYTPVLDMHCAHVQCLLKRVVQAYDKKGNPISGPPPATLSKGDTVICEFQPLHPVYIPKKEESPAMGHFLIREKNHMVGYGLVTEVTPVTAGADGAQAAWGSKTGGKRKSKQQAQSTAEGSGVAKENGAGVKGSDGVGALLREILQPGDLAPTSAGVATFAAGNSAQE